MREYKRDSETNCETDNRAENQNGNGGSDEKNTEKDIEQKEDEKLEEYGQMTLDDNSKKRKIHLLSIIGEVEGHENLSGNSKTTKYDHILPKLAEIEDDDSVEGGDTQYLGRGRGRRPGDCGDDRFLKYSHRVPRAGRQPFYRRTSGRLHGLFLYRADRNHDGSSGSYDWHGHRSLTDV